MKASRSRCKIIRSQADLDGCVAILSYFPPSLSHAYIGMLWQVLWMDVSRKVHDACKREAGVNLIQREWSECPAGRVRVQGNVEAPGIDRAGQKVVIPPPSFFFLSCFHTSSLLHLPATTSESSLALAVLVYHCEKRLLTLSSLHHSTHTFTRIPHLSVQNGSAVLQARVWRQADPLHRSRYCELPLLA